jgi:hypothetical protein
VTELGNEMELENALENPETLAAAQALIDEEAVPELDDPLDGPVTLPAGYRRAKIGSDGTQFEDVRTAWVKELNGEDEERIARTKMRDDIPAFLHTILECGVERLGEARPTREDLDSLLVGDQQFLLMQIARATYGDDLHYDEFVCPHCREQFDVTLSLHEDIPVTTFAKPEEASFEVRLRNDRIASVTLPTVEVAALMAQAETPAEANTILVAHCVSEIRGPNGTTTIAGDVQAARKLGLTDRQALVTEMGERMPGPQYKEVKFNHEPGCGKEIRLSITLADLFLGL